MRNVSSHESIRAAAAATELRCGLLARLEARAKPVAESEVHFEKGTNPAIPVVIHNKSL